jgi:cell division protein FtsZ
MAARPEPARGPVVVEHIPEYAAESEFGQHLEAEAYGTVDNPGAHAAKESAPELVPVRASVFDDDFFRRPKDELSAKAAEEAAKQWPDAKIPSFAGYVGENAADNDELDIPAFLRRKQ